MKTTRKQDIIISRMTDYISQQKNWDEMTKDMRKPIWIGYGTDEKIRECYRYLDKYEYALNAVLDALNVTYEHAEKLYNDYEAYCATL